MADWPGIALRALSEGPTALVTILATEGSAPRGAGVRMVATRDALHGTIGGGALEHQATAQARAILDLPPGSWRIQDYPLGPLLGQCCGGRVRLLIEHLGADAADWLSEPHPAFAQLGPDGVRRSREVPLQPPRLFARGDRPQAFIEPIECRRVERLGVAASLSTSEAALGEVWTAITSP